MIRRGILRFLKGILREISFWPLAVIALGMIAALITFDPADPAWTHTVEVPRLHNLGGVVGAWFADVALYFFGYPAYLLPLGVAFAGWRLFKRGALLELDAEIVLFRVLGFAVALATACGFAALHLRVFPGTVPGDSTAGGLVGVSVGHFLVQAFGFTGGNVFMVALLFAGSTLATGVPWLTMVDWIGAALLKVLDGAGWLVIAPLRWMKRFYEVRGRNEVESAEDIASTPEGASVNEVNEALGADSVDTKIMRERWWPILVRWAGVAVAKPRAWWRTRRAVAKDEEDILSPIAMEEVLPSVRINPVFDPRTESQAVEPVPISLVPVVAETAMDATLIPSSLSLERLNRPGASASSPLIQERENVTFALPSLNLLDPPPFHPASIAAEVLEGLSRRVERLLKNLGIEVWVVAVTSGPVITRIEVELAPDVKISQISNLAKDLARGLSVVSVRVVEIIPGKSVVGLEIPNPQREIVYLREVLESATYDRSASPLTLALGKDISGHPTIANLAKMPHLLVAGATGSGKSVAINTMLLSLLYKAPPSEVRLILVDSKRLKLSVYEAIPHLLTPVVTDMQEAVNALRWCVAEMERRCRRMAALKVRNIMGFNRKVQDALATGEGLTDPFWIPERAETPGRIAVLQPLPFVVVVIDELADMMSVGKKVEELIVRLAQKARAAGIHLILATQRPSVNVITGLIKANIPTRVALQVSSPGDSHTILDQTGAEQLLGHGDMLYLSPGTALPQRVHGAFVDDHEVNRVVGYLRRAGSPDYLDEVLFER